MFRLLFWLAAVFAFTMAALPHPPEIPGEPSDKVQHIAAFTCLALLGTFAYPRLGVVRLALGLSAFGAFIEVVQLVPSLHRDADTRDWLADTAAVIAVIVAVYAWRRIREPAR